MEWSALGFEAWATLSVVTLVIGLLVSTRLSPNPWRNCCLLLHKILHCEISFDKL
jgi:hypothetical protein